MGFRTTQYVADLAWRHGPLAGLEIRVRPPSGGAILDFALQSANLDMEALRRGQWRAEDTAALSTVVDAFCEALISWNLQDEQGNPLSATRAVFRTQTLAFMVAVLRVWQDSAAGLTELAPRVEPESVVEPESTVDPDLEAGLAMRVAG